MPNSQRDWRVDGVKVIKSDRLDSNTPQTPGMLRAAAVNAARGSQKIWAGTVIIHPNAKTGAHHHGALESVIYVVRGVARMRWGERLEFVAEADAGDFIFVPPYVPHQEINRSSDTPLECVLVAATMSQWSSTSISTPRSGWKRCIGSIRSTQARADDSDEDSDEQRRYAHDSARSSAIAFSTRVRKLARAVSMRIASMGASGARSRMCCCARMISISS